ncbi:hypothetical protein LI058_15005 [Clostridium perfringens]|uniref:hypothetical protein n=1 Tax=Clostridium perfringens TaxID=1502 RepID=UPI002246C38E|nr:hypothetical protein [Clostridium perfringens]MCX0374776.1 hypothetical protein [Clostridium perfringens]MCX0395439.1 hypothetical protein [Clostridium perfringens]MCX0402083.1 hypothetical protein [Clostridium perfringens]
MKKCILLVLIIFMINTSYSNFEVKCLETFSLTSQSNVKYACSIKSAYIQDNLGNEVLKVDTGDMLIINKKLNKKVLSLKRRQVLQDILKILILILLMMQILKN